MSILLFCEFYNDGTVNLGAKEEKSIVVQSSKLTYAPNQNYFQTSGSVFLYLG